MPGAPSTGRDLHVDVPLSNVVVGRRPAGFIADQLLPITPVSKQSDMYYKFNHGEGRRYEADLTARAPGTEAKKVHMTVSSDTYFAKNYALATDWPVEDAVNADEVLAWAESNAMMLTDRLMMDYERRVADTAVDTTAVYSVTTINTAWSNTTGSRPLDDMLNLKESYRQWSGEQPNLAVIPEQVMTYLRRNDQLRDILYGDGGGMVSEQQMANLLGVQRVLVPVSQINTFGETETINGSWSLADVWGNHFWFAKVNLLSGRYTDTWINAFRWTSPMLGVPFAVQRHPYDTRRKAFDIEVGYYQSEKIISSDLAVRVASVI
jgi:hypothetical protein